MNAGYMTHHLGRSAAWTWTDAWYKIALFMPSDGPIDIHDPRVRAAIDRYWRQNLRIMAVLLAIWAFVGLGCGILFADVLNGFHLGGFPLGFWFAQQGSIVVFVLLILVYCVLLNRLDDRHHEEIERIRRDSESA